MKYIITESQFDRFFMRRLPRIDGIINDTFDRLLTDYDCMDFKRFWDYLCDDVWIGVRNAAYENEEVSSWQDEDLDYDGMLETYLDMKEHHYKIEYNKRCK